MSKTIQCKFSECTWLGPSDDFYYHCEKSHKKYIREIGAKKCFNFSFEEMKVETFLLCGDNGLYWFLKKPADQENDGIARGIFALEDSEILEYTLKLGTMKAGRVDYFGPFKIQEDTSNEYDIFFHDLYLENLIEYPVTDVALYFEEPSDSDDEYIGDSADIEWTEEELKLNEKLLEKYTCGVCYEHIKANIRFCENKHCICPNCFLGIQSTSNKLTCPQCRGNYAFDCDDPYLDDKLKLLKYPN